MGGSLPLVAARARPRYDLVVLSVVAAPLALLAAATVSAGTGTGRHRPLTETRVTLVATAPVRLARRRGQRERPQKESRVEPR